MIELQWHEVVGDSYHTLLRITPTDQKYWSKDKLFNKFTKLNKVGDLYFTLGAGPEMGDLVSNINRTSDAEPHIGKYIQISIPKNYRDENEFIRKLIENDSKYKDHLDYDLFPAKVGNEVWYMADDGYNSNSYVAGLLISVGVSPPTPPVSTPGFQKPVPAKHFK